MKHIESRIVELLRSSSAAPLPGGVIKCEAADGVVGFKGPAVKGPKGDSLSSLLAELREASEATPQGPWYRCNIVQDGPHIRFDYFWESTPFTSIKDVEPDLNGKVPSFVFERRFDQRLIDEISDFDVDNGLLFYVPARARLGQAISAPLLEVYATFEWQSDVNNGALGQYFSRSTDPLTGMDRLPLYGHAYKGLQRIGHEQAAKLFAEAVALFAHFYPKVEEARALLGIPAVPRQEESDIMDRFFALEPTLGPARVAYMRAHMAELEQHDAEAAQPVPQAPSPAPASDPLDAASQAYQAELARLTSCAAVYEPVLGAWPVAIESAAQLQALRQRWQNDINQFIVLYQAHPGKIEPKLLLADMLRMGHNIDVPQTAQQADTVLNEVFRLEEFNVPAMLCRARMYVSLHPSVMPEAERLFKMVLARSGPAVDAGVHKGLGFACLHQQKLDEAMRHFEHYLSLVPADTKAAELLTKLKAGERGQTVQVAAGRPAVAPTASPPPGRNKPWWKLW
ncbi:MAG: DUF4375 domain-containing protein [Aquabacterium sp.]|uniref:DMP19 family protein n=1 Tax=Aquabacterium sp. TaxID=1872578 RepID=UPI0025C1CA59|nr:DUF4375 domain-containing protein [Aquabacterium sp.]MBI3384484.1 DUF4375 domain-containing protein [Aquabacterium sp.]